MYNNRGIFVGHRVTSFLPRVKNCVLYYLRESGSNVGALKSTKKGEEAETLIGKSEKKNMSGRTLRLQTNPRIRKETQTKGDKS